MEKEPEPKPHVAPDRMTEFSSVPSDTDPDAIAIRRKDDMAFRARYIEKNYDDTDSAPEPTEEEAA